MAEPKKKMTSTRSGNRRSQWRMQSKSLAECPKCHSPRMPHTVCLVCGTYGKEKVLDVDAKEKKHQHESHEKSE